MQTPISIHALHEESDQLVLRRRRDLGISIHALHEESDPDYAYPYDTRRISIHALHEESDTHHDANQTVSKIISIHALHEESDLRALPLRRPPSGNFNPRSP